MPKIFTSKTQKIGKLAEDAVAKYLIEKGFEIVEQNYTRKWGEIDIIVKGPSVLSGQKIKTQSELSNLVHGSRETSKTLHFIEVKAVSRGTGLTNIIERPGQYRPEDNMHPSKIQKMKTTVAIYLMSVIEDDKRHEIERKRHEKLEPEWQCDLIVAYVDKVGKKITLKPLWNIIL